MVDIIEVPLDVDIHEPLCSGPQLLDPVYGGVNRFLRSKSMRVDTEYRLIDLFQNHPYHFLNQFIISTWDSKWTHLAIPFWNFSPPYGFRSVLLSDYQPNQISCSFG